MGTVSRETNTPVHIINERIETWKPPVRPDFITARALAPLKVLLSLSIGFAQENPALILLFLKGGRAGEEIQEAQEEFSFDCEEFPSRTEPKARILRLSGLQVKNPL